MKVTSTLYWEVPKRTAVKNALFCVIRKYWADVLPQILLLAFIPFKLRDWSEVRDWVKFNNFTFLDSAYSSLRIYWLTPMIFVFYLHQILSLRPSLPWPSQPILNRSFFSLVFISVTIFDVTITWVYISEGRVSITVFSLLCSSLSWTGLWNDARTLWRNKKALSDVRARGAKTNHWMYATIPVTEGSLHALFLLHTSLL